MPIQQIAVLMTSYNRRELTLRSLEAIYLQKEIENIELQVFLVDDGSSDGTAEAVQARFPSIHILFGDGSLFWAGAVRVAFAAAEAEGVYDAYMHINDDTLLEDRALQRLIDTAQSSLSAGKPAIVVGSTRSIEMGRLNYGGLIRRRRGLSLWFELVEPHLREAVPCETMHTNLVLIPAEIARVVGNFEARFRHQFADLDYGLRARQAGFQVIVMPGYAGTCGDNSNRGTWADRALPFSRRWRHLTSPKGVPFKEWLLFTRRHFGWRFAYYTVSPYLKTIASSVLPHSQMGSQTKG